jgi:hypothetical protein
MVLGHISRTGVALACEFRGQPGAVVALETAVEITGPWAPLTNVELNQQGTATVALPDSTAEVMRFYRWQPD